MVYSPLPDVAAASADLELDLLEEDASHADVEAAGCFLRHAPVALACRFGGGGAAAAAMVCLAADYVRFEGVDDDVADGDGAAWAEGPLRGEEVCWVLHKVHVGVRRMEFLVK